MWDAGLENVRTWAGRGGPRDNVELGMCGLEDVWTWRRCEIWDVWTRRRLDLEMCGLRDLWALGMCHAPTSPNLMT